jgi:hypothetical protein
MFDLQYRPAVPPLVEIEVICRSRLDLKEDIDLDPTRVSQVVDSKERPLNLLHLSEGMRRHQGRHCIVTTIIDCRTRYIQ